MTDPVQAPRVAVAAVDRAGFVVAAEPSLSLLLTGRASDPVGEQLVDIAPAAATGDLRAALNDVRRDRATATVEVCAGDRVLTVAVLPAADDGATVVVVDDTDRAVARADQAAERESGDQLRAVLAQQELCADDHSELNRRLRLYESLVDGGFDIGMLIDADANIRWITPGVTRVFGYPVEKLLDLSGWDFIHPDDVAAMQEVHARLLGQPGAVSQSAFRVRAADGSWRWVEDIATNLVDDPQVGGIVISLRDVTEAVVSSAGLQESEARFRSIMSAMREGVLVTDTDDRPVYANDALLAMLGCTLDDIDAEAVRPVDGEPVAYAHSDGKPRRLSVTRTPLHDPHGRALGNVSMVLDVTEATAAAEASTYRATHDPLTGLPNRVWLVRELGQTVERARQRDESIAVLSIDVDQFKLVNDTAGHETGDVVLREVAHRLQTACRDADVLAHLGADEFVVVMSGDAEAARLVAERLIGAVSGPIHVDGVPPIYPTVSIGVTASDSATASDLLRQADAAVHEAKRTGRARAVCWSARLDHRFRTHIAMSNELREALDNGDVTVHYQPIVDMTDGSLLGLEALARWPRRDGTFVPPDQFVPVAEESGLIRRLDMMVLDRACTHLATLRAKKLVPTTAYVAVNVSAKHLDHALPAPVLDVLRAHQLPTSAVMLELTESAVLDDLARAEAVVAAFAAEGVGVLLDDFGTGYSSLASLRSLPVRGLKIDRSFTDGVTDNANDLAIASAILDLARALGVDVVAEGVEREAQREVLVRLGCRAAQGYFWSPALAPSDLVPMLQTLTTRRILPTQRDAVPVAAAVGTEHGLAELLRLHHAGASAATIASALNRQGFHSPSGARWHRVTVQQVLDRAVAGVLLES